ncbi:MAG: hypothetical protein MRERV_66c009 [Mycoplasmataceae bacterium RV_VA103A]|nr:MAG: hypothetical protein MRERV_66c009 [Mycoplasmataceae bacterium RV_VA103A]
MSFLFFTCYLTFKGKGWIIWALISFCSCSNCW